MLRKLVMSLVTIMLLFSAAVAIADHDDRDDDDEGDDDHGSFNFGFDRGDDEASHRDFHAFRAGRHLQFHNDLRELHFLGHERGFRSEREHRLFHRDLARRHLAIHRMEAPRHREFHRELGVGFNDDFLFPRRAFVPPGWSRGRKVGWGGGSVPPGWRKHGRRWH